MGLTHRRIRGNNQVIRGGICHVNPVPIKTKGLLLSYHRTICAAGAKEGITKANLNNERARGPAPPAPPPQRGELISWRAGNGLGI